MSNTSAESVDMKKQNGQVNVLSVEAASVNVCNPNTTVIDTSVRKLSDIPYEKTMRVSSGISELDRVLGGGVMRPSAVLVGGEPGIGKSTIMIQMLSSLSSSSSVLYVSGEESPSQVKMRAERLGLDTSKIDIFCDTRLEALLDLIEKRKQEINQEKDLLTRLNPFK